MLFDLLLCPRTLKNPLYNSTRIDRSYVTPVFRIIITKYSLSSYSQCYFVEMTALQLGLFARESI